MPRKRLDNDFSSSRLIRIGLPNIYCSLYAPSVPDLSCQIGKVETSVVSLKFAPHFWKHKPRFISGFEAHASYLRNRTLVPTSAVTAFYQALTLV